MARRPPPVLAPLPEAAPSTQGAASEGAPSAVEPRSYTLVEHLGTGATSEVWSAVGDASGRPVVLKLGKRQEHAATLAAEALVAALAGSPRLPELVALGTVRVHGRTAELASAGRPFVAFAEEPSSHPLTVPLSEDPSLALLVARDVGEALADLHGLGFAHGDVKPANVLTSGRHAKLIDLGLAGPAHRDELGGATPRYIARGDKSLGDAKARDLLALGLLLAELASPAVAAAADPLPVARALPLPEPLSALTAALLAPEPGARPSARWVHHFAANALGASLERGGMVPGHDGERRVRAAYLRVRRHELGRAASVGAHVARWASQSVEHHRAARAMCAAAGVPTPAAFTEDALFELAPLGELDRQRWLVSLVGSAASSWPLEPFVRLEEPELGAALSELARTLRPEVWTLRDVEAALARDASPSARAVDASLDDPASAAALALRLSRIPPDWSAVEAVERAGAVAPEPLLFAAAHALRLAGQTGRARSLLRASRDVGAGAPIVADILRRSGDTERAAEIALAALRDGNDRDGGARACLARIRYDEGRLDDAAAILGPVAEHAATAEVAALVCAARGQVGDARAVAERGYALAENAEARARLSATLAYVERAADAERSLALYRAAAEHAVQAGAVLEEASYRTGEAALAVDLGELDRALDAARRAALLWEEVLDRPAMSARAWLAEAAAYAAVQASHEAIQAAERAIVRARECGDPRAEAYAHWAIADVAPPGSTLGRDAATRAAALVGPAEDDAIQAAARLLRHAPEALDEARRRRLDDACRHAAPRPAGAHARVSWWSARAEERERGGLDPTDHDDVRRVIAELCALADTEAPIDSVGRAMHVGRLLAAALGDTDASARLEARRARAAERVITGTRRHLADARERCLWIRRHEDARGLEPAHAIDLRQLVLALSERSSLRRLLDRVLDVLIMWTGAERGLLLLQARDATLVPHAARNLGRADLQREQVVLSTSLAERALSTGEPVIAIDAMEELASSYESVHALKLRSVLVLPLSAHGEVLGVVYLDDRLRRGAFGDQQLAWAQAVAPVAALAIADARRQLELERAVKRAEHASFKLEEALAHKETALALAERELERQGHAERPHGRHPDIIGASEPMAQLLRLTERVAQSDVPVLLLGESGSGKELVARAMHRESPRRDRPFVSENCGALPETLLESALFGHVKGAFTGAHRTRVGLFEAADEGSLFLDEIGEMSLGMQTKLLRVLEDGMVRPVGSTRSRKVDVRVIAATHRDLDAMVAAGTFREDLFYRLNVISLLVPPLRERRSDIPLLVEHLLAKHGADRGVRATDGALRVLSQFDWPGNVRQLENEVRRALLLADDVIDVHHLSIVATAPPEEPDESLDVRTRIDRLECDLVGRAMELTGGNQTRAAKLLGVSRYGLHKMMKRLGIEPGARRSG